MSYLVAAKAASGNCDLLFDSMLFREIVDAVFQCQKSLWELKTSHQAVHLMPPVEKE